MFTIANALVFSSEFITLHNSVFHSALSFLALLFSLCGHFLLINTWMDGWIT